MSSSRHERHFNTILAFDSLFSTDLTLNQSGTYFVTQHATPQTGSNRSIVVSNTSIFEDTRANTSKENIQQVLYLKH